MKQKILDILNLSKTARMSEVDREAPKPPLFSTYEGERISLPDVNTLTPPTTTLHDALLNRRSHRQFSNTPLTLEALSYALYMTQGVKKVVDKRATFRTVPSAGARHAFETYVLVNHVENLSEGLYVYDAKHHALILKDQDPNLKEMFLAACLNQKMVIQAAVTFFWVADVARMGARYVERSARYLCFDAGHIGQNLYLVAEALTAGTCAIGAFDDDLLNAALKLDTSQHITLYAGPLGKLDVKDD